MRPVALLDTNVIVAAVADVHPHHRPSLALFEAPDAGSFCVAAHSYAEAYSTLTRGGDRGPFGWPAYEASAALEAVADATMLVGLSSAQTVDAVRFFAAIGGTGPRLYDFLIGRAAVVARCGAIITWNVSDYRSVFETMPVLTPTEFAAAGDAPTAI